MSRFLEYMRADAFGGLEDRQLGPFAPGLNVVYGKNEAGKSSFVALTQGVLFGWENAHGVRNTFRPPSGERMGSLVFAGDGPSAESTTLSRDELGVSGDDSIVADIDRETYEQVFSFNAEELRHLRGSSDVSARLLAAESGTSSSPAAAFVEVEQRIASLSARGEGAGGSIYNLEAQIEEKREQVKAATERNELLFQEHRELNELRKSRSVAAERIDVVNAELEDLLASRAEVDQIDERVSHCKHEVANLREELAGLAGETDQRQGAPDGVRKTLDARLLELDSTEERVLRDKLDELAEQQEKLDRLVDAAKENSATSTAAYEALVELDEDDLKNRRSARGRTPQAAVSVLLPIAFMVAGVPLFVHGRQITSLSFTALGAGLIVFSVLLAIGAFVVLFGRPGNQDVLENRKKDAQWVMLQDSKKLAACQADRDRFNDELITVFEAAGLAEAGGSIRQARTLLDEARDQRAALAAKDQKRSSLELRIRSAEKELVELAATRTLRAESAGLPATAPLRDFDARIRDASAQRDALVEALEGMGERFGQLTQELNAAQTDRELDRLKLEYYELRARLRERKHGLVTLLLARRLLERSISEWESRTQPEVYAWAGRMISMISAGQWVEVATSRTGSLVAVNANGEQRDPRHLSLGTCQQLYLALRMALLITASDVGEAIPVLADDILVHFDETRRLGAARALALLAEHRQVIVFTCHKETVNALAQADPAVRKLTC